MRAVSDSTQDSHAEIIHDDPQRAGKIKAEILDRILDHIFISEDLGVEKPNLGFFDKVFGTIGAHTPDEVLIVGDSLTSDIRGGNNAGIRTCWFNPAGKENTLGVRVDYEISRIDQVIALVNE